ncbi:type II toxin-antitoxin system RelE/ParE family toxin [Caulobacter sp. FWC2]|uniref:type II toxin-antitoxin system RelE/ParE family toxin n=1 Tax=Caulobacter sp. FWC2 TaxID=69664 RepID=UPI000C161233|nr:type II toxin-antitoxin system RelE/ParE family toxin [Caulobacter sp. FWC2]PIB91601.1 addiction module toxin RelE [Caulobacter sp. FWC2]
MTEAKDVARVFKTAWFTKAAKKALIKDSELCAAVAAAMAGQADDLGGGVFKKRLDKNRSRSIILAKGRRYWVYAYLFAKKDRANIDDDELKAFRKLADLYAEKTDVEIDRELQAKVIVEICHDQAQV